MTRVYLVRHATCDPVGRTLAGRMPGVQLNDEGRTQAADLAAALRSVKLEAIYTSPLERAVETAQAIAAPDRLQPRPLEALTEFDFGSWTGSELSALEADVVWKHFNTFRSGTRAPGGELAREVQARVTTALARLCEAHPVQSIAVVSHAEPIRLAVAHYIGLPIDLALRLEIEPASVSVLELADWGARLLALNWRAGRGLP